MARALGSSGSRVLCYHAISDTWEDDLAVPPQRFEEQLTSLLRRGYRPATAADAARQAPRAFHVTFDDAFRSVATAIPTLERLGVPATVFACAAYADEGRPLDVPELTAEAAAHPSELATMDWDGLHELRERGIEIGSHTMTHPHLRLLGDAELGQELRSSRERLEDRLGAPCRFLAYPYGEHDDRVRAAARRAGYEAAFELGGWTSFDTYAIPRVGIWRLDGRLRALLKTSATAARLAPALASAKRRRASSRPTAAGPAPERIGVTAPVRRVSIIAPMLNEAAHIDHFVQDLAAQDYAGEIEYFVADGGSTDGSREQLLAAAERSGLGIAVIDNPGRWVSPGLNECIRRASGDLVIRLDCHTRYPSEYIRLCVEAAEQTDASAIGGLVIPTGRTPMERAVACATDSPFGGVHWTRHDRKLEVIEDVDNIYCGAVRKEAFERAGLFDETLIRGQDDEFNLRLRRAGGRLAFDPRIRQYYTPRGSFRNLFSQYRQYGQWKVAAMHKHRQVMTARSMVPLGFVASLALLGAASFASPIARRALGAEVAAYAAGSLVFGAAGIRRRRESWSLLPLVVASFPTFHLAYGIGLVESAVRTASGRPLRAPLPTPSPEPERTAG
jgi:succinoglycan biosynthesis protein ExoA